jgi:hypothetical protein
MKFLFLFLESGSEIRDGKKLVSGILDEHPGYATLMAGTGNGTMTDSPVSQRICIIFWILSVHQIMIPDHLPRSRVLHLPGAVLPDPE